MRRKELVVVLSGIAWLAAGCSDEPNDGAGAQSTADGWVTLFDGSSFDGWTAVGDANWWLTDGAVAADAGQGHLVTTESFDDFELDLEFWVSEDANSGVFLRCADVAQIDAATCYEVNIFDERPDPTYRTGAIVDLAPPQQEIDAGGRWNRYRITARGPNLVVLLNDVAMVEVEDQRLAEGPITLQYGSGTVMFRNVRIRPL